MQMLVLRWAKCRMADVVMADLCRSVKHSL